MGDTPAPSQPFVQRLGGSWKARNFVTVWCGVTHLALSFSSRNDENSNNAEERKRDFSKVL